MAVWTHTAEARGVGKEVLRLKPECVSGTTLGCVSYLIRALLNYVSESLFVLSCETCIIPIRNSMYSTVSVKKMQLYILWALSTFLAEVQTLPWHRMARLCQTAALQTFTVCVGFVIYNYSYFLVLWKNTKAAMRNYSCTQNLDSPLLHVNFYNLSHLNTQSERYWYQYSLHWLC